MKNVEGKCLLSTQKGYKCQVITFSVGMVEGYNQTLFTSSFAIFTSKILLSIVNPFGDWA